MYIQGGGSTIIVKPIADHSILITIVAALVFIIVLILVEWMQMKWSAFERLIKGPAVIVIENGQLDYKNMRKLRLTVDVLEMSLRTQGISKLSDIKTATIEPNGQLGYELQDSAKPVTLAQLEAVLTQYFNIENSSESNAVNLNQPDAETGLFDEIKIQ